MTDPRVRPVAIAAVAVLVTSVLSVGQVRYEQRQQGTTDALTAADGVPSGDDVAGAAGPSAAPAATAGAKPGAAKPTAATPGVVKPGATGAAAQGGTVAPAVNGALPTTVRPGQVVQVPDYGLKTQGVTAKTVTIGLDYNKSGCGDSGAIEAALGPAVVGDPEKAVKAFTRAVNDSGGIRGRTLSTVTVDDGGLQCPERNTAAAVEMVDQHKVFLAMVGLHDVGDAVLKRHIPIWGGRASRSEQAARGIGQFQLFQDADSDFANWASFGKNYLGTNATNKRACFVHPDTADFNNLEKVLVAKMRANGLAFADVVRYADDASTGQQQATSAVIRMKGKCEQVWFLANNAIGMIFFANAAEQQDWHPTYTFTGRTSLIDSALGGSLMNQNQWKNAVGLSPRVKPGDHPKQGNCKRTYEKYYPGDGLSGSASVLYACQAILTSVEAMNRAIDLTGQLTANSLQVGINAIRRDFYYDSHVPMTYTIPTSLENDFDFTGYDHQTVVKWPAGGGDYVFPEYPRYWTRFGPGGSGGEDLRPLFSKSWKKP